MKTDPQDTNEALILDPTIDKDRIEAHIVDHIHERMPQLDRAEIMAAVDGVYTKLLSIARVRTHIPTLTEHEAMDNLRATQRD